MMPTQVPEGGDKHKKKTVIKKVTNDKKNQNQKKKRSGHSVHQASPILLISRKLYLDAPAKSAVVLEEKTKQYPQ